MARREKTLFAGVGETAVLGFLPGMMVTVVAKPLGGKEIQYRREVKDVFYDPHPVRGEPGIVIASHGIPEAEVVIRPTGPVRPPKPAKEPEK